MENALWDRLWAEVQAEVDGLVSAGRNEVNVLSEASDRFWDLFGSPRTNASSPFQKVKR
ncbi:hypothetical protein [Streptomyces sp. IMTB 2501]|uniref:hypothetical protein n=1 Tax=Streptomyces sp. IMTB 2501 TaxID=1776340 RepID=UPI0015BD28EE|nr:hypothetical protein [Streptomyces sp. IMTB 2501]